MTLLDIYTLADRGLVEPLSIAINQRRDNNSGYRQRKPSRGKVVAVGKGTKDDPTTVKIGDGLIYGKYARA